MKIIFILPYRDKAPVGGYKIVYEYANRLIERGYEVLILYLAEHDMQRTGLPLTIRHAMSKVLTEINPRWFSLDKRVHKKSIRGIEDKYVPDADIVFATAVSTAVPVENLSEAKGKKFYLVQDFENWGRSDEEVCSTYRFQDMQKVLIASWLKQYMKEEKEVSVIPNPIDSNAFFVKNEIEVRNPYTIALLYHKGIHKGLVYAIQTLQIVKEHYPQLSVQMFGVPKRPADLPKWVLYTEKADSDQLLEIYNASSIFLCATVMEGFGLTGAEAMACGCALVSTDYEGVREYAVHMENALLSPVKDVDALVKNVEQLLTDNDLRICLAKRGAEQIKKNNWETAVDKMEALFVGRENE